MGRLGDHPAVRLVHITHGAEIEIDVSTFPEAEPVFAYTDDIRAGVEVLGGLEVTGRMTVEGQPRYMWLDGPRDCVLLKATPGGRHATFRSRGVGEFCLELYHVRPDTTVELIGRGDFCFK